jgi:hypothetical protein
LDVMRLIQQREKLPVPGSECSQDMYGVMLEGWRLDPNSRINGSGVLQRLSELVEAAGVNGEALYWPTDSKSKSESRKVVQLGEGVVDLESPELVERFAGLEVAAESVGMGKVLGEGEFGSVVLGEYQGRNVAIKLLKDTASKEAGQRFATEARILAALVHPHIVRVVGVCFKTTPQFIVVELMEGGDLLHYVIEHKQTALTEKGLLLSACVQIADAMEMLERQRIIHRDLAAR